VHDPAFAGTETVARRSNGNTLLGANRDGVTFFEIDPSGKVVRRVNFPPFKGMRLARLSPEGHLLFGANTDHLIVADINGNVLRDIKVPGARHIYCVEDMDNGAFYRASTGYGKALIDITPAGEVLDRKGGGEDLVFLAGWAVLPNGHTVCSHWTGHGRDDSRKGPQLIEFDARGKVVWTWHDPERAGTIDGVVILE
jgi:hypothetical protein